MRRLPIWENGIALRLNALSACQGSLARSDTVRGRKATRRMFSPPRRQQFCSSRSGLEVLLQAFVDLLECGHVTQRVQRNEVMDRAVVANGGDLDASRFQLPSIGFAFIAKRVVLGGDDQCRRKLLQLLGLRPKR